jgi:4-alpha-glucanotransferase
MPAPASDSRLRVVIGWHMHQPEYRDPTTGRFRLPWTYLHAMKDYSDMAAHLERTPGARAVVNFAPLLLEQLDDYEQRIRQHLEQGTPINDAVLDGLNGAKFPADVGFRTAVIDGALRANEQRLINRYPAFRVLAAEATRLRADPEALVKTPDAFFSDLVVWYHLAWLGEFSKREDRRVQSLIAQQRAYGPAQRRALFECILELVAGIVPRYRRLAERGQVELSMTPYGHPILPLLLDIESTHEAMPGAPLPMYPRYPGGAERARWHMSRALESFEAHFGMKPRGVWCSEGAVSEATLQLLDEYGFAWTATGQSVLQHSSGGRAPADRPYCVPTARAHCFFRDDDLSDRIGFKYSQWHATDAVADLVRTLEAMEQFGTEGRVVTIFLDGENAWEYYPANGYFFLSELYRQLCDHPKLRLCTFSEALDEQVSCGQLQHLTAGSWVYGTFSTWIGSTDKNRGWERLIEAKTAYDGVMAAGTLPAEEQALVDQQLAICEGSDWFWWLGDENPAGPVSDFEKLYRHQLSRLYDLLHLPRPSSLDQVLSRGRGAPAAGGVMKPGSEGSYAETTPPPDIAAQPALLGQRRSGVLCHISSLPGRPGFGDFSHSAYRFIEFCANAGFSVWQVLPLGPTQSDRSPYLSTSANAGNPEFISLDWLVDRGWLGSFDPHAADAAAERRRCLAHAAQQFAGTASPDWQLRFHGFCDAQADWLEDYALFAALNEEHGRQLWTFWPPALRDRQPQALSAARAKHADTIERVRFEQFVFFTQWGELRDYAHRHGVYLFGDLPLFVAQHSADIWAYRSLFWVDAHGTPQKIAGVPPDYFSEDGQLWGNPLYNWDQHEKEGFTWWLRRMRTQTQLFDLIRIDHFRGLEACWESAATAKTAREGVWVKAPGAALLATLLEQFHPLPLVAEDLGVITAEVDQLRRQFALPGMRVLQFAFDGDPANTHLPYNYVEPVVVYTGTHDNDTTLGWWDALDTSTRELVEFHLLKNDQAMPWPAIHAVFASTAPLAMLPLQDLLSLGNEGRMNTPGTVGSNWSWGFEWSQVPAELAPKIRDLSRRYGRSG